MVTFSRIIASQPENIVFETRTAAAEHVGPEDHRQRIAAEARAALVLKYAHLEPLDSGAHVHHVSSEPND
jgi:hypothetical protein